MTPPPEPKFEMPAALELELSTTTAPADRERIFLRELAFAQGRAAALAELADRTQADGSTPSDWRRLLAGIYVVADRISIKTHRLN